MASGIEISPQFDEWIARLEAVGDLGEDAVGIWRAATDVLFAESQSIVHILSGRLLSSGYVKDVSREGDRITGTISYDAGHAIYEFARGGTHDTPMRSLVATQQVFQQALLDVAGKQVAG